MKKILITIFLLHIASANAQVIFGDAIGTAANKTSVLLEFANTNNKGLILPYVKTLPVSPAPGTLVLDSTTPVTSAVKYFDGNIWHILSGVSDITTSLASQPATIEDPDSKVIIGDPTSTADGVLVLESADKALVLPQVTDVQNIINPSPGMLVYVKGATKYLAAFDGKKWAFWTP